MDAPAPRDLHLWITRLLALTGDTTETILLHTAAQGTSDAHQRLRTLVARRRRHHVTALAAAATATAWLIVTATRLTGVRRITGAAVSAASLTLAVRSRQATRRAEAGYGEVCERIDRARSAG